MDGRKSFNGEYYIQKIQVPESKRFIAKGLVAGMGSKHRES